MPSSARVSPRSSGHLLSSRRSCRLATKPEKWVRPCSLSMNGCGFSAAERGAVGVCETRALPAVSAPEEAVGQLKAAVTALGADPPGCPSGIIRLEVPILQRGDAIEWLHAQRLLPRCFFSARAPLSERISLASGSNNGNGCLDHWQQPVSVAGVGSAVFFRGTNPFALRDWRSIKRFLSRDCPLIRAYGAIRFDARTNVSLEWKDYGSFYFIVPQVEFDELEESSSLATTIAWDDSLSRTWQKAMDELQSTLQQISPHSLKLNESSLRTNIVSLNHVPTKASWDLAVKKALQMIRGRQSELVKPEQLFHRKYLNISSEALAGTRARGKTRASDFQIGQDLLLSDKEDTEFTIVRESIKKKLEIICDEIVVQPKKALRKLPRVQHLSAQLAGRMRNEDDEFDILNTLHPSPAVCGLPTEAARQLIEDYEMFDRGMYAGPVGWFGGTESEFAVGIRSALLGKGYNTLVYAGAGIVEGTDPSSEWDELDLKASQFTKLLQHREPYICYQEAKNLGTAI